jgi:hypothetical protein
MKKTKVLMKNILKFSILTLLGTVVFTFATLLPSSEQAQPEQARSADSFVDSIGVAVHLNYGDTAYNQYNDIIKPRLQELGIRHIRDGVSLKDTETQQKFKELANLGIKSTLVMDPRKGLTPEKAVAIAKAVASSIEAVEGPNEWDLYPDLLYNGQNFPQGVRQFQADLYAAIKRDSATANLDVLSPSVADAKNASKLGSVACDIATIHSYPSAGGSPTTGLDDKWLPAAKILCGNKPIIATETGYHNAIQQPKGGVSEQTAAKYLPRLALEYFNRGIKRAHTYELIDLKPNLEGDRPSFNYGLLRTDGSQKPAFIAVKNLIALLQDPEAKNGSFPLKSLDYQLSGDTTNVHHTILQKSDGKFYLILWQEVLSFDPRTQKNIVVPDREVGLIFNTSISQAAIYQPLKSTAPIEQYTNYKQLMLKVPDHPLVIELVPA